MQKIPLFGKSLDELKEVLQQLSLPAYAASQLADWFYKKDVTDFEEMSNLPKGARRLLSENYDTGLSEPVKVQTSADGTKKYLFRSFGGKFIEAAYIPDAGRHTLCVSSQVGCKMGCLFCMTAKQGFKGQLSAGEILNQIRSLPERHLLTNIVYMGMGEPFDNLDETMKSLEILTADYGFAMSPKRITVSTIGIIPGIKTFLEKSQCHLAVSLHSPFEEDRKKLMPIQTVYPLNKVLEIIRSYDFSRQRRISFEYIMFRGLNDTPRHVKELARVLNGIRCRINLLRFHPIPGTPLQSSNDTTIEWFRKALKEKGIMTTLRQSRGQDIDAACGLLSTRELAKNIEAR
ncbi:MAG TPA: 23S rRNA (adenine(2503)-C(2))-methyltransferase RlmN [Bacteroidales bacterium]|nr:23S rRNA (adenine(2503)-C(2))-methyltransferase RlmN [Bacteroidales bacterium]